MIICTVTCADNLHETMAMARSVKKHMHFAKVVVCLVERSIHPAAQDAPWFDEVVLAKDLGIHEFHRFLFKYRLLEGVTAIKPFLFMYLLEKYKDERHVLFMDSDVAVFHPFDELMAAMEKSSILLTVHQLESWGYWESHFYKGIYNTGVIGTTRSDEADRFLHWWGERLYHHCFIDEVLFDDQKWIDLAPALFDVHIFKHPGYNMAAWNLHERGSKFARSANGGYVVGDKPLCCFHFAGYSDYLLHLMKKEIPDRQNPIYALVKQYSGELQELGESKFIQLPWSYDYFESGEKISEKTRKRCKDDWRLVNRFDNPFAASNRDFKLS